MIPRSFRWNNSEVASPPTTGLNKRNGGTEGDRKTTVWQHGDEKKMIASWLSSVPPFLLLKFSLRGDPFSIRNAKRTV